MANFLWACPDLRAKPIGIRPKLRKLLVSLQGLAVSSSGVNANRGAVLILTTGCGGDSQVKKSGLSGLGGRGGPFGVRATAIHVSWVICPTHFPQRCVAENPLHRPAGPSGSHQRCLASTFALQEWSLSIEVETFVPRLARNCTIPLLL